MSNTFRKGQKVKIKGSTVHAGKCGTLIREIIDHTFNDYDWRVALEDGNTVCFWETELEKITERKIQ